ncbi:HAMP domain-containing sensor histidine kinase [Promicromonospora soli]
MLSAGDLAVVVATTVLCTGAVTLAALTVLRFTRRGSLTCQFTVTVLATVAAIASSTVMVAAQMYFSVRDLQVLLWVVGVSALMTLAGVCLIARSIRTSIGRLRDAARRIGDGDLIDADTEGWTELAELSAQLAGTSERLTAARAEIERLDSSRRQFFAWISHDLRTPLTGVRALAEALEAGVAGDPKDYLRRIAVQTEKMDRMVDDLFELSRVQSGALRLRRTSVDLLDIVSGAAADVRELAAARGVRINHSGVEGQVLVADPHELTRAVVNLLTNGIRHAPEGSEILVSAHRGDDRLTLSVLDQGSGVAAEDLDRMFEVGWRGKLARMPDAAAPGSPGAGLGLAIVKGIVEAHGGDVRAAHLDDGFRLDIVLPVSDPAQDRGRREGADGSLTGSGYGSSPASPSRTLPSVVKHVPRPGGSVPLDVCDACREPMNRGAS